MCSGKGSCPILDITGESIFYHGIFKWMMGAGRTEQKNAFTDSSAPIVSIFFPAVCFSLKMGCALMGGGGGGRTRLAGESHV